MKLKHKLHLKRVGRSPLCMSMSQNTFYNVKTPDGNSPGTCACPPETHTFYIFHAWRWRGNKKRTVFQLKRTNPTISFPQLLRAQNVTSIMTGGLMVIAFRTAENRCSADSKWVVNVSANGCLSLSVSSTTSGLLLRVSRLSPEGSWGALPSPLPLWGGSVLRGGILVRLKLKQRFRKQVFLFFWIQQYPSVLT